VDLLRRLQGRRPEEAAAPPARPTLILVSPPRPAPQPEPKVEAAQAEEAGQTTPPAADAPAEPPRAGETADRLDAWAARLAAIEKELEGYAEQRRLVARSAAETAERLAAAERRLEAEAEASAEGQQRVEAALASLSARGEKLYQEIAATLRRLEILESSLQEKTAQGRREAEDIRSQIAPLLEANEERRTSDGRMLAEFDRLRESLADALAEVSDRLRRAVREM
jgi:chromosome segregation ATPase